MVIGTKGIELDNGTVKYVDQYDYLGVTISKDGKYENYNKYCGTQIQQTKQR